MLSDRHRKILRDIGTNVDLARTFVGEMSENQFDADILHVYATTRALEIISEGSRRLPEDLKARHPTISWRAIAAAGNVYRHDYDDLITVIIWDTVHTALPAIKAMVERELAS